MSATIIFEWIVRLAGVALGVAVVAVLTRYLGPARFGDLSLALALTTMAHTAAEFGFKQAAVREASVRPQNRNLIAGTYVILRGLVAVVLFLGVAAVGLFLARDGATRVTVLLVAATLLGAFISSAGFLLNVRMRNELFAGLVLLHSVLWLGVVAVAAVLQLSLPILAAGYLLVGLTQGGATFLVARRLVPFTIRLDPASARLILRVALPLALSGLFLVAVQRLGGVLVYRLAGAVDGGVYAAASRVIEQLQIVPSALVALIYPLLASWHASDPRRFDAAMARFSRYLLIAAVPVAVAGPLVAEDVAVLLFGTSFAGAGPLLAILCLAFPVIALNALMSTALVALGRPLRLAAALGIAVAFNVVANVVLLPAYGAVVAAVVTVVTETLLAVVLWNLSRNRHGRFRQLLSTAARLAVAGTFLYASIASLEGLSLFLALFVGGVVYLGSCLITGVFDLAEVRGLASGEEVIRV